VRHRASDNLHVSWQGGIGEAPAAIPCSFCSPYPSRASRFGHSCSDRSRFEEAIVPLYNFRNLHYASETPTTLMDGSRTGPSDLLPMPLRSHPAVRSPLSTLVSALHQWAAHHRNARAIVIAYMAGTGGIGVPGCVAGLLKSLAVASSPRIGHRRYQVEPLDRTPSSTRLSSFMNGLLNGSSTELDSQSLFLKRQHLGGRNSLPRRIAFANPGFSHVSRPISKAWWQVGPASLQFHKRTRRLPLKQSGPVADPLA
jgi:hypothetical protein